MSERLSQVAVAPFEAARRIAIRPAGHRARRLHGHSFLARVRAEIAAGSPSPATGESDVLSEALRDAVEPVDYGDLNEHLPTPTDGNLVRWLRDRLDVPGVESVGIQSTRDRGADLDGRGHVHIWRRFRFEAAHWLPHVPAGHPCGRLHGHGFEVVLHLDQDAAEEGRGPDRAGLAGLWAPLQHELHHACLNDIAGLENPTSELLAHWIWRRLEPCLRGLSWVSVYETGTVGCHYDGEHFRIWKERPFEAALRLPRAPEGDPRRRWHGHSYRLRLHLTAPLDGLLGWTVDYGDVKALFQPVYEQLDHRPLNDLPGLGEPDASALALWIREASTGCLPQLDRIDLYETPGSGVSVTWGDLDPVLPFD